MKYYYKIKISLSCTWCNYASSQHFNLASRASSAGYAIGYNWSNSKTQFTLIYRRGVCSNFFRKIFHFYYHLLWMDTVLLQHKNLTCFPHFLNTKSKKVRKISSRLCILSYLGNLNEDSSLIKNLLMNECFCSHWVCCFSPSKRIYLYNKNKYQIHFGTSFLGWISSAVSLYLWELQCLKTRQVFSL